MMNMAPLFALLGATLTTGGGGRRTRRRRRRKEKIPHFDDVAVIVVELLVVSTNLPAYQMESETVRGFPGTSLSVDGARQSTLPKC